MKRRHFKKVPRPTLPVAFRLDYGGILAINYDEEKNAVTIVTCDHEDRPITLFLRAHEIPEIITALDTGAKSIRPRTLIV